MSVVQIPHVQDGAGAVPTAQGAVRFPLDAAVQEPGTEHSRCQMHFSQYCDYSNAFLKNL